MTANENEPFSRAPLGVHALAPNPSAKIGANHVLPAIQKRNSEDDTSHQRAEKNLDWETSFAIMGTFCSSGDQEKPFDSSNRPQAQEPVRTETKADFGSHVSAAGGGLDRGRAQDGDKSDGGGVGWLPAGLRAIWDRFADDVCDEEGGSVLGERAGDFLRELHLDPEGVESFAFFWKLQHESFGTLSRDEFADAMSRQGVWHEDALREWARRLKSSIATDSKSYRQMYRWLFGYLKEKTRRKTLGSFSFGLFFLFFFIFSMYDHEPDPPPPTIHRY